MRFFIVLFIVIINFFLQSTILQYFNILGIIPNTSLIIIISFALLKGKKLGGTIGILVGLIQDIIFGNVIGVYGLIYFAIGYLVGLTDEKVFKENLLIPFAFAGAATIVFHLMYYTFMYFLGINVSFMLLFKKIMIIEIIYNSILAVFIYKNIAKLYRQPTMSFRR